jgi:rhamnosyltransferase
MMEEANTANLAQVHPRCSVIIRSYNEGQHIGRLLKGIRQQTLQPVEIILVDSGSTDQTVSVARAGGARVVSISPEEFTFGRSLNRGIAAASGDILVFASAHVYPVYADWLKKLTEAFADQQIALVYGKQVGAPGSRFSEQRVFASWYPDVTQTYQENAFCNNANAAVRRSLALARPYDETLPGLEDLEWGQWALDSGYKIHYAPEAVIVHVHHETPRAVYNRYRREAIAFKKIYIHERFGFLDFARLTIRNIIKDAGFARQEKVLLRSIWSIIWFRVCQFWGTYQGYRYHGPLTWELRQRFYYPRSDFEEGQRSSDQKSQRIDYQSSDHH